MTKTFTLDEVQEVCAKILEEYEGMGTPALQMMSLQLAFLTLRIDLDLLQRKESQ